MKKSLYICNANTTLRVVGHTNNTAISVFPCGTSASRSCVVFAKLTKEIRSLFVHTRLTCYTMRTPNKQATKAKDSNLYAPIYKGQALYFGWLLINKTFTSKADAVAWYDKHQQGWRYRNAVAVVWQGCTRRTPSKWLKCSLCGGEAWQLAINRFARNQAQCDAILQTSPCILVKA